MGELLFSFRGRTRRLLFWLIPFLAGFVLIFIGGFLMAAAGPDNFYPALMVLLALYLPFLWISFAITVKRLHDRDKSAWWLLLFFVVPGVLSPVAELYSGSEILGWALSLPFTIWAIVELGFLRGTRGPNRYGRDPLDRGQLPAA